MTWNPVHTAHSIEGATVTVHYAEPLTERAWTRVMALAPGLAEKRGLVAGPQSLELEVLQGARQAVQVGQVVSGSSFVRVDKLGKMIERWDVAKAKISLTTLSYSRWKHFSSEFFELLSPVFDIVEATVGAEKVQVEYVDRFVFDGQPSDANRALGDLLKVGSPYLTPFIFETSELWHVHTGQFVTADMPGRTLLNVNVNMHEGRFMGRPRRSVVIRSSATHTAERPEGTAMRAEWSVEMVERQADSMHLALKDALADLITDRMATRIALTRGPSQ